MSRDRIEVPLPRGRRQAQLAATHVATRFHKKTKDLVALKEVLGHSDLLTVLRYVNDSRTRMDKAMEAC